jgi:hypothetical protein
VDPFLYFVHINNVQNIVSGFPARLVDGLGEETLDGLDEETLDGVRKEYRFSRRVAPTSPHFGSSIPL